MTSVKRHIAVIGGTGALGGGLALRWAEAGHKIVIGSRSAGRACDAAAEIRRSTSNESVSGESNQAAAAAADVVVLTVPFAHHRSTLAEITDAVQGKLVVDTTVPLVPPKVARVQLSEEWPIARTTQQTLGENVRVVSAFHNVAAAHLRDGIGTDEGDVLVFGNDKDAREIVVSLADDLGLKAWHAGSIDNSVVGEALTSVLIFLNKRYKIDGAGIRITGAAE
ncbi:MAG: NADPH-dependent F420 reductase [Gammaproteobacteria bacterium]|nr:NADPH-dependent F420 reductase [Gammaproteobacteria bacterium]